MRVIALQVASDGAVMAPRKRTRHNAFVFGGSTDLVKYDLTLQHDTLVALRTAEIAHVASRYKHVPEIPMQEPEMKTPVGETFDDLDPVPGADGGAREVEQELRAQLKCMVLSTTPTGSAAEQSFGEDLCFHRSFFSVS